MVAPVRLQISRRRGANLQAASRAMNGLPAVVVARPTLWGNYAAVRSGALTGAPAVHAFETWVTQEASAAWKGRAAIDLRSKNLACWCKLCPEHAGGKPLSIDCSECAPCHADALGQLLDGLVCEEVKP